MTLRENISSSSSSSSSTEIENVRMLKELKNIDSEEDSRMISQVLKNTKSIIEIRPGRDCF